MSELPVFTITPVGPDEAILVHLIAVGAFREYEGALLPPSGALLETEAEVAAEIALGGAALAWADAAPVGSVRLSSGRKRSLCRPAGGAARVPVRRSRSVAHRARGSRRPVAWIATSAGEGARSPSGQPGFFRTNRIHHDWFRTTSPTSGVDQSDHGETRRPHVVTGCCSINRHASNDRSSSRTAPLA